MLIRFVADVVGVCAVATAAAVHLRAHGDAAGSHGDVLRNNC